MADEEVGRFVIVLVFQFHGFRNIVEQVAVGYKVQFGPTGLDGVVELHIAFHVVAPVEHELLFVPYFQVFQVERFRVTVLCAQAPIIGFCAAVGVFNGIKRLLNKRINVVFIHPPIVSDAHVHHKHGIGSEVFGQFEVFVVALSVGDLIIPVAVYVARTFFYWSYGLLPLEAVGLSVAPRTFNVATSRKTHETWVHIGQHLG